jgi:hypothetical protein
VGTRLLASTADRWAAQATSHGWRIAGGRGSVCPCETTGWPFAATIIVPDASLAGGERFVPGGVSWSAGSLSLSVALLHPFTLSAVFEGQQTMRVSHAPTITFQAASMTASVPFGRAMPIQAQLQASGIAGGIKGSHHPQDLRLDRLRLSLAELTGGKPGVSGKLDISMHGVGLPDIIRWPLGGFVSRADASLILASPPMPFWDTQPAPDGGDARAQAEAWRDGNGLLTARGLYLHWGPLTLAGSADLRLDDRLQPAGTGTADVAGTEQALRALSDAGLVPPGLAITAAAVLAVMPHVTIARDHDSVPAVRLPFVLRNSTLSVGQIPLVQVDDIAWRRHPPM